MRARPEALAIVVPAVALVYLLLAPVLPQTGNGGLRLDAALGTFFVCAAALAVAPLSESLPAALLLLLGSVLLAGVFDAAGARAGASLPEAVAWAVAGTMFARVFGPAPLAVGVPLLVGGLDVAGVVNTTSVLHELAREGDPLTLELPRLGGGQAAVLPALEAGLLGALAAWASRHGFRRPWTALLMLEAAVLAVVTALPSLALVCAAYLLANLDRAAHAVREEDLA